MFARALAGIDINIDSFGYAARLLSGLDRAMATFDQYRASEGDHGLWGYSSCLMPTILPSSRWTPRGRPIDEEEQSVWGIHH